MPPVPLRLSWRTWLRWLVLVVVALACGVIAFTAGVAWYVRILCGVLFLAGTALALDLVVFGRTWDVDGRRWWVPSLWARGRIIPVDDHLVVELVHANPARLRISGGKGSRDLVVSPLVGYHDLDRWFDTIAGT